MTDKSFFSESEWRALSEAPLYVALAMGAVGEHGPISMVKEAAAAAHVMAVPGDRGAAGELIVAIAHDAQTKEARHDTKEHRGKTLEETATEAIGQLDPAATAIARLPVDEADAIRGWLVDIARAVANAAKGLSDGEQATIDRIALAVGAAT